MPDCDFNHDVIDPDNPSVIRGNYPIQVVKPEVSMEVAAIHLTGILKMVGNSVVVWAGGCVRDRVLGIPPKDIDIATNLVPDQVKFVLERAGYKPIPVGEAFGVVKVIVSGHAFEIATLRSESDYADGRRPNSVTYGSTLEEDAKRRDLTMNAMFFDPFELVSRTYDGYEKRGKVIDFFNGENDAKNGIIRAVGDPHKRFAEDYLRMLRVVRFACRFDKCAIDPETSAAIFTNAHGLQNISKERIITEFDGILKSDNPDRGLRMLRWMGLLGYISEHANGLPNDQFDATCELVKRCKDLPVAYRIAAFLLEFTPSMNPGNPSVVDFCTEKLTSVIGAKPDQVAKIIERLRSMLVYPHSSDVLDIHKLLGNPDIENDLLFLKCIELARKESKKYIQIVTDYNYWNVQVSETKRLNAPALVTGDMMKELGVKPSPAFAKLKEEAYRQQLMGYVANEAEAKEWVKKHGQCGGN